jgi:hypothetical protein
MPCSILLSIRKRFKMKMFLCELPSPFPRSRVRPLFLLRLNAATVRACSRRTVASRLAAIYGSSVSACCLYEHIVIMGIMNSRKKYNFLMKIIIIFFGVTKVPYPNMDRNFHTSTFKSQKILNFELFFVE